MIKSIEKKISTLKDKNNDVIKGDTKINIKDAFFINKKIRKNKIQSTVFIFNSKFNFNSLKED